MAKLRKTNADYVAIAVSPALIMALVGSLVFFLIEVLYVGEYQTRLSYVFALLVFATVLIGRISIEMGSERAAMYSLPLGIAVFLVLAKFVQHSGALSNLINVGLIVVVWWSAHKLTWNCTLIDDDDDASGEGLMQHLGVDDSVEEQAENQLLAEQSLKRGPHPPGLWVLYFSLAALPLFGLGQRLIPAADVDRRRYVFALLAVYVASGLALLVTTSFLGLRRYLRQRHVEMPTPMAATWVITGGVLIAIVMLLAALIPRPYAEYAISQVPWQVDSSERLASSRTSVGNDGADDQNEEARQVPQKTEDPNATATIDGQGEPAEGEGETPGGEGESSEQSGESAGEEGEPMEESQSQDRSQVDESTQKSDSAPKSETFQPKPALPDLLPTIGGLTGVLKIVFYLVIAVALGYLAWTHRERIAAALADLLKQIRALIARLLGRSAVDDVAESDDEKPAPRAAPLPAFASFKNPFAGGRSPKMPADELVRYTFEAFEAWACERGHLRRADQTPHELVRRAVDRSTSLFAEAKLLARLYNVAAYAPGTVARDEVLRLEGLWELMCGGRMISTDSAEQAPA